MTQVYIWPLSAVLKALANKIKNGTHHFLNLSHALLETKQIEEQTGWLQHLLVTASGTNPSEFAQAGNTGEGKTLDVGETNTGPTDVVEGACLYCWQLSLKRLSVKFWR